MPLDFLQSVIRDAKTPAALQIKVAQAILPYIRQSDRCDRKSRRLSSTGMALPSIANSRARFATRRRNAIEDAMLARINARYMAFAAGPEMQGRARLAELERRFRVAFGPPLTNREQALLFCLSTLYPPNKADCDPEFLAEQSAFSTVEVDCRPPVPRGVGAFRSGGNRRGVDVFGKVAGRRRD
jgi:hypothetical protein